ncbi:MAG TPA: hypothetical protein DCF68_04050 [Cyanothece sp. UBA12306]|nr:hypothetical protein [Cyanothece sp. UBA12306]
MKIVIIGLNATTSLITLRFFIVRDIISHKYDEVDLEEVWTVITVNLPSFHDYILPLLPEEHKP